MRPNVFITHRVNGNAVEHREGHNVVVDRGRTWMRDLIHDPAEVRRVKYMGFGVGSQQQTNQATVLAMAGIYSVGSDPHASSGFEYQEACPIVPVIQTLEMPIRFTGGITDYPGGAVDRWLTDDPGGGNVNNFMVTHTDLYTVGYYCEVDGTAGELVYPWPGAVPISEVGLFLADESPVGPIGHKWLVAYHSFTPIMFTTISKLEVSWYLRF